MVFVVLTMIHFHSSLSPQGVEERESGEWNFGRVMDKITGAVASILLFHALWIEYM